MLAVVVMLRHARTATSAAPSAVSALEKSHAVTLFIPLDVVVPLSLSRVDVRFADICHVAPNVCSRDGHLQRLMLPPYALRCSSFPTVCVYVCVCAE